MNSKDTFKAFKAMLEEPGPTADYILETFRIMWKADRKGFTESGLDHKMIKFFFKLLEHNMKEVNDPNVAKVNIINILKAMEKCNETAAEQLAEIEEWDRYKHQKHDLFVSRNETADKFIEKSNQILALEYKE